MVDVLSEVRVYDLAGKSLGKVSLPGPGTVHGFGGDQKNSETFYVLHELQRCRQTFIVTTCWRIRASSFVSRKSIFSPDSIAVEQVFYHSKDGTRVPMILTYRKDLKKSEPHPTLLYGYGGYNISLTPGV